jgi:uncharacterized protein YrzB (UPF0473 family)
MNEENTIILVDEQGNELEFQIIDMLEIDEEEYAILLPKHRDGLAEEAIILKIGLDEDGEEILFEIEDDDEWHMVANIWRDSLEENTSNN